MQNIGIKIFFHPTSKMSPISFHLYSLGSLLNVNNSKHLVFLYTFVDLWKYFKFIVVLVFLFNIGLKDRLSRTAFDSFHYHCPLQLVMYKATLKVFHSRLSSSAETTIPSVLKCFLFILFFSMILVILYFSCSLESTKRCSCDWLAFWWGFFFEVPVLFISIGVW